ncbi:protein of unknown function [Xenorhabdus nematophila AN6/1]|nr:hypothetical protein XNA1_1470012 [Xenorhabdus nematophila str. Anatoliense]CEE92355.1 hypothetical protein XNA1_2780012 [Xenorhabdus nematophila str. Anatoliense]CEF28509.1 hypothetical protein XNW1_1120006 [Xenorhabdus nematophila str. Websteri]CEF30465.1 hypothetical protein XNW1_2580006 [Xenorhabdus nematophila str. Websteri]CEK23861.1 protein of unknown function [Xenorhabdus nematophila AN6/1]
MSTLPIMQIAFYATLSIFERVLLNINICYLSKKQWQRINGKNNHSAN